MEKHVLGEHEGEREKFIGEIKHFIEKECAEIGELLAYLSWTPDRILKSSSIIKCPYDSGHQMPESSLKHHGRACRLKSQGVSSEELETELQNDDVFYKDANLVGKVQLDERLLNRILWNHSMENRQVHMGHRTMPVSGEDWRAKLSSQERLAVYEYCVQTLKADGKMANVEQDEVLTTDWERIVKKGMLEQGGTRPKTKFELLAMLRDQKRRRQSYRAKNVHITKKSYTEIIREVIQNQMEIMMPSEEIKTEQPEEEETAHDKDSTHHSQRLDRDSSRNRSCSPRRQRDRSENSNKRRYYDTRESRSSQRSRSRSRSRSPRGKAGGTNKLRREDEGSTSGRSRVKERERNESSERSSHPDQELEEGQVDSDDSSHHRKSHSRKKSSKHKKHKSKKRKSRSHRSDSD